MASELGAIAALADNPEFRTRVRAAGHEHGRAVVREVPPPQPWETEAMNRRTLYRLLVTNPDRYLAALALAVAGHNDVSGADAADEAIRAAVAGVWNDVAAAA